MSSYYLGNVLDELELGALDKGHLVFAGNAEHGDDLRVVVESTRARYEVIA